VVFFTDANMWIRKIAPLLEDKYLLKGKNYCQHISELIYYFGQIADHSFLNFYIITFLNLFSLSNSCSFSYACAENYFASVCTVFCHSFSFFASSWFSVISLGIYLCLHKTLSIHCKYSKVRFLLMTELPQILLNILNLCKDALVLLILQIKYALTNFTFFLWTFIMARSLSSQSKLHVIILILLDPRELSLAFVENFFHLLTSWTNDPFWDIKFFVFFDLYFIAASIFSHLLMLLMSMSLWYSYFLSDSWVINKFCFIKSIFRRLLLYTHLC